MRKLRFGIEVEFTGISREAAASIVTKYFNVAAKKIGKSIIIKKRKKIWRVVRDGSIEPITGYFDKADDYCAELVTPVCNQKDFRHLKNILILLKKSGAVVNASCGLHIHLDAKDHTLESIKSFLIFWYCNQDVILKAFNVLPSRLEKTCKKINADMVQKLTDKEEISMDDFRVIWYEGFIENEKKYNKSRYRVINMHSLFTLGTIEFRFFNGTLDNKKIQAYLDFCLAINKHVLRNSENPFQIHSTIRELIDALPLKRESKKSLLLHIK